MHQKQAPTLPSHTSATKLAQSFSDFFVSKIEKIRTHIDEQKCNNVLITPPSPPLENISSFNPTTDEEIKKVIDKAKSATCNLDPIPTSLLKECSDLLLPTITEILNLSLSTGIVPSCIKHAIVRPLLKKKHLDHDNFKNYRPVSNLPFISKVLEKIVVNRLLLHMEKHNLHETMQSAYKQQHSTETALIRVQNDILTNLDKKRGVLLVLLDLSAAFDTIDHTTLLHQLQHRLGISGMALQWFDSYLTGRTQSVSVESVCSEPTPLRYGVPQGSVLGPLLYTIYTLPLGDILREAGISYHLYADDTQIYMSFSCTDSNSQQSCLNSVQRCVTQIKSWMLNNKLKLNDDKTEVMYISSRYYHRLIKLSDFSIDDIQIKPATSVRNIGVLFDSVMSMGDQVTAICQSTHYHLRNIGRIRKSITYDACEKLVHALVTSRLDCGNALLYGLPEFQNYRLQKILHIAARILTLSPLSNNITPILKELHWLPIEKRIEYKIILTTFKSIHALAPQYICELLKPYPTPRELRSSDANLLAIPQSRTKTYGDRAFSVAAPILWNSLPDDLRASDELCPFKRNLKTFLFNSAYNVCDD